MLNPTVHSTAHVGAVSIKDKAGHELATIIALWPTLYSGDLPYEPDYLDRQRGVHDRCAECGCSFVDHIEWHYLGCSRHRFGQDAS